MSVVTVLDTAPVGEALRRCDATFAASWWHRCFLGRTGKPPERVINADPDAWYRAGPGTDGSTTTPAGASAVRSRCCGPPATTWRAPDGDVPCAWRDWAGDRLDGGPVDSGRHIAEEAPEALVTAPRAPRHR